MTILLREMAYDSARAVEYGEQSSARERTDGDLGAALSRAGKPRNASDPSYQNKGLGQGRPASASLVDDGSQSV
jgi:hypothetical protein